MGEPHRDAIFVAGEGLEYEQQESINIAYVVVHEGNRVLGGARPLRTDHECPSTDVARHGYMIRDAGLDHLPTLPADLLYDRDRADFVQGSDGRVRSKRPATLPRTCR